MRVEYAISLATSDGDHVDLRFDSEWELFDWYHRLYDATYEVFMPRADDRAITQAIDRCQ